MQQPPLAAGSRWRALDARCCLSMRCVCDVIPLSRAWSLKPQLPSPDSPPPGCLSHSPVPSVMDARVCFPVVPVCSLTLLSLASRRPTSCSLLLSFEAEVRVPVYSPYYQASFCHTRHRAPHLSLSLSVPLAGRRSFPCRSGFTPVCVSVHTPSSQGGRGGATPRRQTGRQSRSSETASETWDSE